jgi:hypothetical protein
MNGFEIERTCCKKFKQAIKEKIISLAEGSKKKMINNKLFKHFHVFYVSQTSLKDLKPITNCPYCNKRLSGYYHVLQDCIKKK